MMEPVVDFHLQNSRLMQIHLLFTLPEIENTNALCVLEQLVPIAYKVNKLCFDLLLLSCEAKWFVTTQAELEQCFRVENAALCPKDFLSVVEDPTWLGLKWVPETKLSFQHSHVSYVYLSFSEASYKFWRSSTFSDCSSKLNSHRRQRFGEQNFLTTSGYLSLSVSIFFPSQRTALASCASRLNLHFLYLLRANFSLFRGLLQLS